MKRIINIFVFSTVLLILVRNAFPLSSVVIIPVSIGKTEAIVFRNALPEQTYSSILHPEGHFYNDTVGDSDDNFLICKSIPKSTIIALLYGFTHRSIEMLQYETTVIRPSILYESPLELFILNCIHRI